MRRPEPIDVDLGGTYAIDYEPGRSFAVRALWHLVESVVFASPVFTSYRLKVALLRLFGARIGEGVLIKPRARVKHPWRLHVGDHVWIGEAAWIDNLAPVEIGANACVSQGAYLCTGNHDWSDPRMPLFAQAIILEQGSWVAARAVVGPGARLRRNSIVGIGSVLTCETDPDSIWAGNPAVRVGTRKMRIG